MVLQSSRGKTKTRYVAAAQIGAWLAMGLVDIVVTWLALPMPGIGVRLLLHLYDVGQLLAVGLASAGVVVAWRRWGPKQMLFGYGALALLSILVSQLVLRTDLRGAAAIVGSSSWQLWASIVAALFSLCIPVGAWLSWRSSGTKLRWGVGALALLVAVAHQFVLPNLYPGIHTYGSWFAATLLAGAIAEPIAPWVDRLANRRRAMSATAAIGGLVVVGVLLVPAPTGVQIQMRMLPGAVVARYKTSSSSGETEAVSIPPSKSEWFEHRGARADIAVSTTRVAAKEPIVILFVVDAMRADLLSPEYAEQLPNIASLMRSGVTFTRAYSTAPSTNASVTALFASRYPAQINWKFEAVGPKPRLWPDDTGVRIGDVLASKNVESAAVVSTPMKGLKPQYGCTAGQRLEINARNQYSANVVSAWQKWFASRPKGPLFAYLHVVDPHAPYNLAGNKGAQRTRYTGEVALVDRAIGKLMDGLRKQGLDERTIVILTADHGEAFGEHNSRYHGTTIYNELMLVPLVIAGKGVKSRTVDQPVSLVDIAPTVLDLFGATTPGSFMGQSLVPLLAGEDVSLTRPIFLDSHVGYAGMVFDDGLKIIVRDDVPELYDLQRDPGELHNIYGSQPDAAKRFAMFKRFATAHRMKFEKQ